jgi:hypothetical protein
MAIDSVALPVSPMSPFCVAIRSRFYLNDFVKRRFASECRTVLELASVLGAANYKN